MPKKREDFQRELDKIFSFAEKKALLGVLIRASELHQLVGDYPSFYHSMQVCCNVMKANITRGDWVMYSPRRKIGESLKILYKIPRDKEDKPRNFEK